MVLGLFMRLWIGPGSYPDIWGLQDQIETQNLANDQQAERNRKLQSDVTALTKDDESIEDHARSELGMVKANETFYQVILKSDVDNAANAVIPAASKGKQYVEEIRLGDYTSGGGGGAYAGKPP